MIDSLSHTAWVFLLLAAIFLPLEHAFSVRPQGARRRGMRTDLFFFLGQHLLFVGPVVAVLALVHGTCTSCQVTRSERSSAHCPTRPSSA